MATILTSKYIENPAQLDEALGNVGVTVRSRGAQWEVESNSGAQAALQAAVDAYVHNPDFGLTSDQKRKKELAAKPNLSQAETVEAIKLYLKGV